MRNRRFGKNSTRSHSYASNIALHHNFAKNSDDVLGFLEDYQDLGSALQSQLQSLLSGDADEGDVNPNAIRYIKDFCESYVSMRGDIGDFCNRVLEGIDEWRDYYGT